MPEDNAPIRQAWLPDLLHYAFIGLSKIRESAVFGGDPIAAHRDQLRCGIAAVELRSGNSVAYLEFQSGVDEIFDVQVLSTARNVSLTGPFPSQDEAQDIWVVPSPATSAGSRQ